MKEFLDKGTPCVLGLQGDGDTGNHYLIAFGCTMGQYLGDLGAHIEDLKIYVYDPNRPNKIRNLIADVNRKLYYFEDENIEDDNTQTWRTYFVDKKYQVKQPPIIPNANYPVDNLVRELVLCFSTGDDDLRGGSDNIDLIVSFIDGTQQEFQNINLGKRWVVGSEEYAEVVLQKGVKLEELNSLLVRTTFSGGVGGDNWDMTSLKVYAYGGGMFQQIKEVGFKRFTGSYKEMFVPLKEILLSPGQISKLSFNFRTGDDDLRGDKDNINLTVHFSDGTTQRLENANESVCWQNNTTHILTFDLNRAVKPSEITQIDLDTTFSGGVGGDNWNMESMTVTYTLDDSEHVLVTSGFKRFTGTDKSLTIPIILTTPSQANSLVLTFHTGSDNLRGGNDNLDVTVDYRDGTFQFVPNVNGGAEWRNDTTNVVNINLDHSVLPNDIINLKLETTFKGGWGGDNWNMNSVQVAAIGPDVNKVIFNYGYKRFTGDDKTLIIS